MIFGNLVVVSTALLLAAYEPEPQGNIVGDQPVDAETVPKFGDIERALKSFQVGDITKTEEILDQINRDDLDPNSLRLIAGLYLKIGLPEKSLKLLNPHLSKDLHPETMVIAGLAFDKMDEQILAEYWLKTAANSAEVTESVGNAYVDWLARDGSYSLAYVWLSRKLGGSTIFRSWLQRLVRMAILSDKTTSTIEDIHSKLGNNPEGLWMLSILYGHTKQWPELIEATKKALSASADNNNIELRQGITQVLTEALNRLSKARDYQNAIKVADLLLSVDNAKFDWLQGRMRLSLNLREYSSAEQLVNGWSHISPGQKSSLLGDIELARKNLALANDHYVDAWKTIPSIDLASRLSSVRGNLGLGDVSTFVQEWAEKDPSNPDALLAVAMTEINAGRTDQAIIKYKKLLEQHPKQWIAHNNIAWLYTQQESYEDALKHAQLGLKINPNSALVMDTLAWIYHLTNEPDQAKHWIEQALKANPNNPQIKQHAMEINN